MTPSIASPVARRGGAPAEASAPSSPSETLRARGGPGAVVTRMTIAAPPARVWDALVFYEQLDERPPFLLRLLLPVPIRTEARKGSVGDEVRCLYEGGHLVKRVTRIDPGATYAFDVVEQALAVGGGLRLHGGWYALRALPDGGTEIETGTRYESPLRPRWLFRPIEAAICHGFHRHILRAVGRRVRRHEP